MAVDQFQWWRDALAGRNPAIHEDQPQPGYYYMRPERNGPRVPVAIWTSGGTLLCRAGGEAKNPVDIWTWVANHPVSEAHARQAFADGTWPGDVPQSVARGQDRDVSHAAVSTAGGTAVETGSPKVIEVVAPSVKGAVIGDNSRVMTTQEEIDDVTAQIKDWLSANKVDNEIAANQCKNWRDRITALRKSAETKHKAEKLPHDEAVAAIHARWKPFIEQADGLIATLRRLPEEWLKAETARKQAIAAEAARVENARRMAEYQKAEAERRAAVEMARAEAAAAMALAAAQNKPVDVPVVELPPEPDLPTFVAPDAVKVHIGGQRGKRGGLKTETRYVVSDYAALLDHVHGHPDVMAVVEKVGRAMAKSGASVPGLDVTHVQVAA